MQHIEEYDFSGKRALIRVDFNVPLTKEHVVSDDTRIQSALPTIKKVLKEGGSVVLMSHLGRPKSGPEEKYSLKHIIPVLSNILGQEVKFADDCIGKRAKELSRTLKKGEVLLLENLRFYPQEKMGDDNFAQQLSEMGDVYVNDAFGTAHRAHASTTIIARFFPENKMFGFLIEKELKSMDKVLHHSEKPLTAIMGGAKVSSKIVIIERLLEKVNHLIIGGGMTFTFIKARGGQVGNSIVESEKLDMALDILEKAEEKGVKVHLPSDALIADKFDNEANRKTCAVDEIPEGWMGLDIGPETAKSYEEIISSSKTILWNGPMGVFEMDNFETGTKAIAHALVEATKKGAFTLVGGGDSVAAVNKFKLGDEVSYVSTGGGALLEYMEGKSLPGIKAIRD